MQRSKLDEGTSDLPDPLPEGQTVADLPEISALYEKFTAEVGDPAKTGELRQLVTDLVTYTALSFRGAVAWRDAHDEAMKAAMAKGGLRGRPEEVPMVILAAFWCDVAFESQRRFWAAVGKYGISPTVS